MRIPWGRRLSDQPLGRVADFCAFCRGFQPFQVMQAESIRHFYNVALGGRKVEDGYSKVCETCSLRTKAIPTTYRALCPDPGADLATLIAQTNPDIERNWAARLMLEDRIKTRKLTEGERVTLLREPFAMAEDVLNRRNNEGRLDTPSNLGCLGSFLLPVACLLLLPLVWNSSEESIELVTVVVAGFCLTFTFLAIVTDNRRHARRDIMPRLVGAIRPLNPSVEEVNDILQSLKEEKSPLAEVIRPAEIHNALVDHWG